MQASASAKQYEGKGSSNTQRSVPVTQKGDDTTTSTPQMRSEGSHDSIMELLTIPTLGMDTSSEASARSRSRSRSTHFADKETKSESLAPSPSRRRSHAIDLADVDLSSLSCKEDPITGMHLTEVASMQIHHPPSHRRIDSSSRVAFAVDILLAEQEEAARSEQAHDDDKNEDKDDDSFHFYCDTDSEVSELPNSSSTFDDQFSFWEDFSCNCSDKDHNALRPRILSYIPQEYQDDDTTCTNEPQLQYILPKRRSDRTNLSSSQESEASSQIDSTLSSLSVPITGHPGTPPRQERSQCNTSDSIESKPLPNLSPVSVAAPLLHSLTNTAA